MSKCKLCRENDLDNTGAHIFTDALIRSGLYIDGQFKRGDYEAIAVISKRKVGYTYFGAGVIPEIREELLGRPQSEEEILETSEHLFINRELVCRTCERKFNPIETYFNHHVYRKILDSSKCKNGNFQFNDFLNCVAFLMILINIWRASASKFNDWQVKKEDEEIIRNYLNKILVSNEIGTIVEAANKYRKEVSRFKFQLLVTEQTDGNLSENLIYIDYSFRPYIIFLNRLIILFSDNGFSDFEIPDLLRPYITRDIIEKTQRNDSNLTIYQLTNEQRRQLIISYFDREWRQWVNEAEKELNKIVRVKYGRDITPLELRYFHIQWAKLIQIEMPTYALLEKSIECTLQKIDNRLI